mmetsp:Transcript_19257/g.34697  ORF Transcript_19257/g.34697 Transcript_19257/m.34697 type:complete len:163 (-) Transcript_19257:18-506(-)
MLLSLEACMLQGIMDGDNRRVIVCVYTFHFPNMGAHPAYATQCCRGLPRQFLFGDTSCGESNDGDEDVATLLPTFDASLLTASSSEDGTGSSTTAMPVVVDDEGSSFASTSSEDNNDGTAPSLVISARSNGTAYGFENTPSVEEPPSAGMTYVKSSSPGICM